MNAQDLGKARSFVIGLGGALLIASFFLPWAETGGSTTSGWELASAIGVLALFAGLVAILAAVTGGPVGFFRPDVSIGGAADLFGVATTLVIGWFVLFDFPAGAQREYGAFVALAAVAVIAGASGDYRVLKGAPAFPSLRPRGREAQTG